MKAKNKLRLCVLGLLLLIPILMYQHISLYNSEKNNIKLTTQLTELKKDYNLTYTRYQECNEENYEIYNNFYDMDNLVKISGEEYEVCPTCEYWQECYTNSMAPTFTCDNTLTFIKSNDVEIGNIIMFTANETLLENEYGFQDGESWVIHRVIGYKDGCYITKGDNVMVSKDKYPVCPNQIFGVLKEISYES